MAKGQEAMASSACEKKESPAEPSEILVNRLDHLSMICQESITVSSGLGKQEEFGSQHTSRREGAGRVREPVPAPIPRGHKEGGRWAPWHCVRLCPHSSRQRCVSHRSGEAARALGTTVCWCEVGGQARDGPLKPLQHQMPLKLMHGSALGASPAPSCGADPTDWFYSFIFFLT